MDNWAAVEIADALVTALNGETWTPTLTFYRRYAPVRNIDSLDCLIGTVLPFETANPRLVDRRPIVREDITVSINVQKKVTGPECNDEIDPLTKLVQDVADHVRNLKSVALSESTTAVFQNSEIAFDFASLRDPVVFTGWTNIVYTVVRA